MWHKAPELSAEDQQQSQGWMTPFVAIGKGYYPWQPTVAWLALMSQSPLPE